MATLAQFQKTAQKLNSQALSTEIFNIVRSIEKEFTDKNKEQIFNDSTDIYGKALGYYSYATEKITKGRKKAGQPYTGYDTGDWFKGFYAKVDRDTVYFGSTDSKSNEILKGKHWLTTEFFGLTDNNLREVIEQSILPLFISAIRGKLGI